ncbi:MAG: mannosyl-3-phosphoglycerate phosphatase [Syntrophaceae bacterium]|nr:mannosyl-3-phosphoglycerate phosphatase [Syntrophaceae bacterium]
MTTTRKLVVFTDLDGTLLHPDTYSFEPAIPALRLIKEKGIPLILSSSKTRAEMEFYRKKLDNHHPFISENGGALFVPKDSFSFPFPYDRETEEYFVLELGQSYAQIVEVFEIVKAETGMRMRGFSDMTDEELISLCGLSPEEVRFAKKREYDEPFVMEGGEEEVQLVKRKMGEKGMRYVWGGRFHHLTGKNDKGKAVRILKELYENQLFSIATVGIGDSLNDIPMLLVVDHPIFLKGEGTPLPEALSSIPNLTIVNGTGPQAWNDIMLRIIG